MWFLKHPTVPTSPPTLHDRTSMAPSTEAAPHGQPIASEDRSSFDRLERMQRQRRILGEAITQGMTQSTSSTTLLSARSEETAAFFVQAAATKKILRHSSSEGSAVLDKGKRVSFFPMVEVHSEIPRPVGKHTLLTDQDDENSPSASSPR